MLQIIRYFFVTLGVIFFILLVSLWYVWHTDMWSVRTVADYILERSGPGATVEDMLTSGSGDGIDIARQEWSEMELECFRNLFGVERVAEIEAGATPTALELMRGMECVESRE